MLAFLPAVTLCVSLSEPRSFCAEITRHFEWGEYNQIIEKLEPFDLVVTDSMSPHCVASLRAYLGVAYFSREELGMAKRQFELAWEQDSTISLKRDFVTDPMYELFAGTINEQKLREAQQAQVDSLLSAKEIELSQNIARQKHISELESRSRSAFILGLSSLLASAATGAFAVLEWRRADELYADFETARDSGYLEEYRRLKKEIRSSDYIANSLGVITLTCAATGAFFMYRSLVRRRQRDGILALEVGVYPLFCSIALKVRF
ncbi:MAG: hypothetical protein GF398_12960 [Chitinivibrionales bacterium]|nr:hypothetical protein [Chitinivibrionales bacterium]